MIYPYQQQFVQPYQQPGNYAPAALRQDIVKVTGENGARAYNMAPNSSILMLDEQQPIVWLKTTDGAGYATITPYSITPYKPEPTTDIKSLEDRITRLEGLIHESDNADAKWSKQSESGYKPCQNAKE